MKKDKLDMDTRVDITMAISRWLRAKEDFRVAGAAFNETIAKLQAILPANTRYVASNYGTYYLVETRSDGDFDITEVESI